MRIGVLTGGGDAGECGGSDWEPCESQVEEVSCAAGVADIAKFEAVFPKVEPIFKSVKGYISHELQRCIETKGRYHFLIRWETVESHTVNFRQSPKFQEFRGLVGGFFAQPPVAEHFERVTASKL